MANIEDLDFYGSPEEVMNFLKQKSIILPTWGNLLKEYEPTLHPVMNRAEYPDIANDDGTLERVTRVTYNLQRLAVKRMVELCNGIPVQRVYTPTDEKQKEVASVMERVFQRNRIDSVNNERLTMLFAGCEVLTLWYGIEDKNNVYGFKSNVKFRCRNFSPMLGDELYPLFDEYGDMVAMSVAYTRKVKNKDVSYFDAYTKDAHYKWGNEDGWQLIEQDDLANLGKIPAVYVWRPTPIWEDTSRMVYEMEWAMSRNGNYLRKNSKPLFVVTASENISYGNEENESKEFRSILQLPSGSSANYVTWGQAIDNLKFYVSELRSSFFTQLQLPDWNYEKMSQQALSGESRKQLFIDAQLKVKDESGRLIEFFDREVNVIRQFLKLAMGESYAEAIENLSVENVITPFYIGDDATTIDNLMKANGNKPLMSQREAIARFGYSQDVEATLNEIKEESEYYEYNADGANTITE